MNGIKLFIKTAVMLAVLILVLSSCHAGIAPSSETNPPETTEGSAPPSSVEALPPTPPSYEAGSYTLMIYMCGSDLETRSGSATKNIEEMLGAKLPDGARVIIQTGGAKKWRGLGISAEHSSRYEIVNGELVLLRRSNPVNMGQSDTLLDFLKWGEVHYPAERRALILWDHGGGSMKGVCSDEQFFNDTLTLPEVRDVLASVVGETGKKYDFVGLDACLMATYDTACVLAPYANCMIASQELEPASGWDYTVLLSSLGSDSFCSDVLTAYGEKQADKVSYTLSAVDLTRMQTIHDTVRQLTEKMRSRWSNVKKALSAGKEFGSGNELSGGTNLFDLGIMAESISLSHSLSEVIQTSNGAAHRRASGISLFFPTEQREILDDYAKVCQSDFYLQFLTEHLGMHPEEPIRFISTGFRRDGKLSFTLTNESEPYVQFMGYTLLNLDKQADTDILYGLGTDNNVSFAEGVYTVNFRGRWFFLNELLLHTTIFEINDTHAVFSAPVRIGGEVCRLLFSHKIETGATSVDGYVIDGDITSRIHELTDGTEVTVLYEEIAWDGTVRLHEEDTVVWSDSMTIAPRKLSIGYYQCIPYVVDIYGGVHHGCTAVIFFDGEQCVIESISEG